MLAFAVQQQTVDLFTAFMATAGTVVVGLVPVMLFKLNRAEKLAKSVKGDVSEVYASVKPNGQGSLVQMNEILISNMKDMSGRVSRLESNFDNLHEKLDSISESQAVLAEKIEKCVTNDDSESPS